MDDMNAFERQVAAEVTGEMPPSRPVDVAAVFTSVVPARPPRSTASAPQQWLRSMFGAAKFAVAGVIVAAFGALLLVGLLSTQSDEDAPVVGTSPTPEATSTPPIELPLELPAAIESGTLETPLGSARWAHLSGEFGTLPRTLEPYRVPDGYVALGGHYLASPDGPPMLWRSPDLVTWTPEALPVSGGDWGMSVVGDELWLVVTSEGAGRGSLWRSRDGADWHQVDWDGPASWAQLVATDEAMWIVTEGPTGLWRSSDGTVWTEVDLSGLEPPAFAEADWQVTLGPPMSADSIGVVPVYYRLKQGLGTLLGLDPDFDFLHASTLEPGVYTASGMDGFEANLTFSETSEGLVVADAASGERLAQLDGAGIELIERWAERGWLGQDGLALIDENTLRALELPTHLEGVAAVFGTPAGLRAYAPDPDRGPIRTWVSTDGVEWTEADPISDGPDEPSGVSELRLDRDAPSPTLIAAAENGNWRSIDGTTWERRPDIPGGLRGDLAEAYDAGMWQLAESYFDRADGGLAQAGVAERAIETLYELAGDVTSPEDGRYNSAVTAVSPNTVALGVMEVDDEGDTQMQDIWVVTFDDLPA